jgi:threonine/homoserine/homoserine lactone efflux protein
MEFLLIASAHFLALLSPGPDFFLILQTALRLPLRYAFAVCVGITGANAAYLMLAVLGLETVRQWTPLMLILRYLGAAYLVYVGILLLRAPMRPLDNDGATSFLHARSLRRQFALGFMSGMLNPKNAIFYLSLFTAMVSPMTSLSMRGLYGLWMASLVLFWDMGVAMAVGNERIKARLGTWIFRIEKSAGAMLAIFGILLAID